MNSREKIHEFVNMARHPEAKDLAEALEMESKFSNCIFKFKDFYFTEANRDEINAFRIGFYTGAKEQLELDEEVLEDMEDIYLLHHNVELSGVAMDNIGKPTILGRPITAFDVCWALNKKTAEFNFSVDTRGISFSRFCKMEVDGNLVSCMPSLQGLKRGKGNIPFKTIEEDGTHTILDKWSSKICNQLAILMYSNEEIIEITKLLSRK